MNVIKGYKIFLEVHCYSYIDIDRSSSIHLTWHLLRCDIKLWELQRVQCEWEHRLPGCVLSWRAAAPRQPSWLLSRPSALLPGLPAWGQGTGHSDTGHQLLCYRWVRWGQHTTLRNWEWPVTVQAAWWSSVLTAPSPPHPPAGAAPAACCVPGTVRGSPATSTTAGTAVWRPCPRASAARTRSSVWTVSPALSGSVPPPSVPTETWRLTLQVTASSGLRKYWQFSPAGQCCPDPGLCSMADCDAKAGLNVGIIITKTRASFV